MEQTTILIIDDEEQMRKLIRTFLEKDGYSILEARDGAHALQVMNANKVHLCIVDVMMPFMDGFTFAQEVKHVSNVPLIFLSAKGEEWDKIQGLRLGGDDYIVKPFMPGELIARVESVLRRTYHSNFEESIANIGPLSINNNSYTVELHGKPMSLTRKEFGIISLLAKNAGRVYSREQLLQLIWGDEHQSSERTVDTHIKTLRLKMGADGNLIETVWGVGYKFEVAE